MLSDHDTRSMAAVHALFEDVRNALQAAQALLDAGVPVDLTGMDARFDQVCGYALELPPPLARATLPDLVGLRGMVDSLIDGLSRSPPR